MESLNVRNVSIAILVLIIGIEFIEYFSEEDEKEEDGERRRTMKKPDVKKILGLSRDGNGLLKMADERGVRDAPRSFKTTNRSTQAQRPSVKALGLASENGSEVIGSRTYTIRTVLDGNHIYLEKIERQSG